jgi:hypothetical protein
MIPERPLFWKGIPLFHIRFFSRDFFGRLYFVLGQGLGDHVNGFRVLHEIRTRFPKAHCIVYADQRWEDLVCRISEIEIRWFPKAKDVLSREGTNNPYDQAHEEIRTEIRTMKEPSYLAYAHFPMPDRYARRETTLEATARSIGLSLKEAARPYLPVKAEDLAWAEGYLKEHALEAGKFVLISPYSWENKRWGKENFSRLIDALRDRFHLRTVVVSYPEIGPFGNTGVVCAYDLSLGQISGLMQLAGLYIGLDSGPSHMAAFFDLPMVVVFIEKRTFPFEVRPLTPLGLYVVESFFSTLSIPGVETVLGAVTFLLSLKKKSPIPECPMCTKLMQYVLSAADPVSVRLMCSCGSSIEHDRTSSVHVKKKTSCPATKIVEKTGYNFVEQSWTLETLRSVESSIETNAPERVDFLFSKTDKREWGVWDLPPGSLDIRPDSIWEWMWRKGYRIERIDLGQDMTRFSFARGKEEDRHHKTLERFRIPWGNTLLVAAEIQYLRWFSYETWGTPGSLVGIVKAQAELSSWPAEIRGCAWAAFLAQKSMRSFRWLIKGFLGGLKRQK